MTNQNPKSLSSSMISSSSAPYFKIPSPIWESHHSNNPSYKWKPISQTQIIRTHYPFHHLHFSAAAEEHTHTHTRKNREGPPDLAELTQSLLQGGRPCFFKSPDYDPMSALRHLSTKGCHCPILTSLRFKHPRQAPLDILHSSNKLAYNIKKKIVDRAPYEIEFIPFPYNALRKQ